MFAWELQCRCQTSCWILLTGCRWTQPLDSDQDCALPVCVCVCAFGYVCVCVFCTVTPVEVGFLLLHVCLLWEEKPPSVGELCHNSALCDKLKPTNILQPVFTHSYQESPSVAAVVCSVATAASTGRDAWTRTLHWLHAFEYQVCFAISGMFRFCWWPTSSFLFGVNCCQVGQSSLSFMCTNEYFEHYLKTCLKGILINNYFLSDYCCFWEDSCQFINQPRSKMSVCHVVWCRRCHVTQGWTAPLLSPRQRCLLNCNSLN